MPKNKIGGSGAKRAASKNNGQSARLIPFKEELQDYGIVKSLLGNGRVKVFCLTDNVERLGTIRGSMYKKVWINKDDVVLISLREYQDDKCDIIFKYNQDEVKTLKKQNEIPKELENASRIKDTDDLIEFDNGTESDKVDENNTTDIDTDIDIDIDDI